MRTRLFSCIVATATLALTAEAQLLAEPAPNGVVFIEASRSGITRIAFQDDRVASVQKISDHDPEGDFSASKDDATGDLYIVIGEKARPVLSFFATTEAGHTYQIMMGVRDVPTLQVKIAAPSKEDNDTPDDAELITQMVNGAPLEPRRSETPVVDLSSVLIKAMYSGARIDGFETRRYRKLDWLNGPLSAQGFSQRGVIEWAGNGATGYAITVRNETTEPNRINYGRLAVFNVVAATGEQDAIARRNTGQIFLVVKGDAS